MMTIFTKKKINYLLLVTAIFIIGCKTPSEENEEVQLNQIEFTPYEGPPIRPNDRALEDKTP